MTLHDSFLSPRRQAHIYASGFLVLLTLGTLAAIGLCLAALWLLVELTMLLLISIIECCSAIGTTYAAADPLVKFLILVAIGAVFYYAGRRLLRRA